MNTIGLASGFELSKARGPEGLTYGELFPNFFRVNIEERPPRSARYFRCMLRHLVSDPQTHCLPLTLVWFAKKWAIFSRRATSCATLIALCPYINILSSFISSPWFQRPG